MSVGGCQFRLLQIETHFGAGDSSTAVLITDTENFEVFVTGVQGMALMCWLGQAVVHLDACVCALPPAYQVAARGFGLLVQGAECLSVGRSWHRQDKVSRGYHA